MKNMWTILLSIVFLWAFRAAVHANDPSGFDSEQGFIPNNNVNCRVWVDIPGPLEDGMILELDEEEAARCRDVSQWRVTEYTEGKFFAAPHVPLPEPLVVKCVPGPGRVRSHCQTLYNLRDQDECTVVATEEAPIEDAHKVLKTEECERTLYDGFGEVVIYRGLNTGVVKSHIANRRIFSEFKRWLVQVDDPDTILGYTLVVVEEFAPDHGNARWHAQKYDDVTETSCPPGDWRDIIPFEDEAFDTYPMERAHERAAHHDYQGHPPVKRDGMSVVPPGSSRNEPPATGDQIHRVVQHSPSRCVATARMVLPDDPGDTNVQTLRRMLREEGTIIVFYSPIWRAQPIWYRRIETNGEIPEAPNWVYQEQRGVTHRDPEEESPGIIEVPSKCPPVKPCPVCPEAPSRPERQPTRTRRR